MRVVTADAVLVADRDSSQSVEALVETMCSGPQVSEPARRKPEWGRVDTLEHRAEFLVERYDIDPGAAMVWRRRGRGRPSIQVLAGEADLGPACGRFSAGEQIPVTFEELLSIANHGDCTLSLLVSAVACEETR